MLKILFVILCLVAVPTSTGLLWDADVPLQALRKLLGLPAVAGTNPPPDFRQAQTVADVEPIVAANLDLDLQFWRSKGHKFTHNHLMRTLLLPNLQRPDLVRVIMFYNNTLIFPFNKGTDKHKCEDPCNGQMHAIVRALSEAMTAGEVQMPDSLFFLTVHDNPAHDCPATDPSPAPFLAIMKSRGDCELLVPQFSGYESPKPRLFNVPWIKKIDKAFFRGRGYCCGYGSGLGVPCIRTYLAHLTYFHNNPDLDAGLLGGWGILEKEELAIPYDEHEKHGPMPAATEVFIPDHAYWRYLLQLDGIAGSFRMGQLMFTNSLVFKQNSHYVEFYSNSIKPWVHYVPFWNKSRDDLFEAIHDVRARLNKGGSSAQEVFNIVDTSQRFAVNYLTRHARVLYWRAAIERYNSLFVNMTGIVADLHANIFDIPVKSSQT